MLKKTMGYGVAVDCVFRGCDDFRNGNNFVEIFDFLKSINAKVVEINSQKRFERDERIYEEKLRLLGSSNDFTVTLHVGKPELTSLDEEARKKQVNRVIEEIEYNCRFLRPELIVLHPGTVTIDAMQRVEMYSRLRESTLGLLDCCVKHNIKLTYENMRDQYPTPNDAALIGLLGQEEFNRVFIEEPKRRFQRLGGRIAPLLEFVRSFNSDLIGVCLDTGHANISEGSALPNLVKECGDTLFHIHACDNFGITDDHLSPGSADIAWGKFYKEVKNIGYTGAVVLEILPRGKSLSEFSTRDILRIIAEDHDFYQNQLKASGD